MSHRMRVKGLLMVLVGVVCLMSWTLAIAEEDITYQGNKARITVGKFKAKATKQVFIKHNEVRVWEPTFQVLEHVVGDKYDATLDSFSLFVIWTNCPVLTSGAKNLRR